MERPHYFSKYIFDWEMLDVLLEGKSTIDASSYLGRFKSAEEVEQFVAGYGFNLGDPIIAGEFFGNFQEAVQFIKRYFLKEGNPEEGLDLTFPISIFKIRDIKELFLMASGYSGKVTPEESLWATIVLKVMHTVTHADKDLRHRYFSTIQQQIFDGFYKFLLRDENGNLFFGKKEQPADWIPIADFQTKPKKSRDSIILKLLHKVENVAEELFDRIGLRIVTHNRLDCLRVIQFLCENYTIIPQNIKPSRSHNSYINLVDFRRKHHQVYKQSLRNNWNEKTFIENLEKELLASKKKVDKKENEHSLKYYESMHFTCRQLINYRNPFMAEFNQLRRMAIDEKNPTNPLIQKILSLDTSLITNEVRFFYPFEVQVTDKFSHEKNTQGQASHKQYKKNQGRKAMKRLFLPLLNYKKIPFQD
ncbi:MAG: TIGR04552 family protein [Bacteriovoracaceae bacterium]|nr:TIGR04552 family protein [Bacteriovoracaceae bacterium]